MTLEELPQRLDDRPGLDRAVGPLHALADRVAPAGPVRDALQGTSWLGHPVHPALTDLPIGCWTSAWFLDLAGRRAGRAADVLVALGVVSAVPTVAAGLADFHDLPPAKRRSAAVHAAANAGATALYAASLVQRLRGRRGRGIALGWAGAATATAGAFLGGHLAFGGKG